MIGAVIYVRVSTKEQTENLSLPTQLRACEEYCRRQGYEVLERFHEEGGSAKTTDRSQLQSLLTYCRLNKGRVHFVVVFNLTRFARDKYDHFALRSLLQSLGISLRSATEPIDDTSTGKLMEGVLAAFAQFDNDCRSDRTRAGMKAALELGRWVFLAPLGYLNAPRAIGKSLMPDPERAPIVCRVFEAYATGRFTKQQVLEQARVWGLTNRRNRPLTSQAIGVLLRNQLYAGIVDVTEYGVRGKRGDFEPLISEDLFYRVQSVLSGRVPSTTPQQRAHPDFPLRAFVRCESCGRGLTGSWSKGRSEYYAYYHCRPGCRAVNVTKARLEGLFADELALLQPTPGYMRLLKESVLQIWKARKAAVREELASAERAAKLIQDKLDRLDEAFLFERSIDIETYDRHAEKLREELTLARMDRHSGQLDELDVEGILAFAERVLPRAADLWVQASLEQRQRFQQLFFPDGISFDGNVFVGTAATAPAFSYLREIRIGNERVVDMGRMEPGPGCPCAMRGPWVYAGRSLLVPASFRPGAGVSSVGSAPFPRWPVPWDGPDGRPEAGGDWTLAGRGPSANGRGWTRAHLPTGERRRGLSRTRARQSPTGALRSRPAGSRGAIMDAPAPLAPLPPIPPLPDSLPKERCHLVTDIVTCLCSIRGVTAIVLGGSHAIGAAEPQSDIDLGVYYSEIAPFSIDEIRRVAHQVAPHSHPVVTGFHEWGPWVNGGVWLIVDRGTDRAKVDLLYRNVDQVEHTVVEAVSGVWHHDFDQQPTFGFRSVIYLAEIMSCLPLHDPHGRIAALKRQVALYPGALKYTIVSDSLWSAEFTLSHARAFARKADVYNTVGCLTRIASSLTQALFALNETYFLNDKHAPHMLDGFVRQPSRYRERIEEVLAKPGRSAQELAASVDAFAALWQEVTTLTEDSYKPRFRIA